MRDQRVKLLNWIRSLSTRDRLISRKEITRLSPDALLKRSRGLARPIYVGDNTVLCRVLGRYRLFVTADDVGFGAPVMLDGAWETWLTSFMARRIRPGMAIVDAGANHGYYTLMFAHLTGPTGRVAAVEPHPRTAALLRKSVYANGFQFWTTVIEQAAGAEDSVTLSLSTPDHEPKNAHLSSAPPGSEVNATPVAGARLATMIADWPKVDFIKADVEGAEEAFIEGAWPVLERDRPALVLEFNAGRCGNPSGLLDRLAGLYGDIGVIERDGKIGRRPRTILEDRSLREDWLLFFEAPAR